MRSRGASTREGRGSAYWAPRSSTGTLIVWPEDFGTRFSVFVDTEEEFDWSKPFDRNARSTRAMAALPALHARFAERAVPVTYLIDYPIVTSPEAVAVLHRLLEDGCSTVGTQLHPWVNPPHDEEVTSANSFVGSLPRSLEAAKIGVLTDAITAAFGTPPRIYRAGRYGIGPSTLRLLAERGYRIDSSMRARFCYAGQDGPSFTRVGNEAFRPEDGQEIVELPLTTVFTGWMRRKGPALYPLAARLPLARGALARLRLLNRVALTPEEMPLEEALEAVRVAVGEGLRLLNFSYHSPSAEPGHTPYVRDAADLAAFRRWWEAVFDLLDRLGVRPVGQRELLAALDRA